MGIVAMRVVIASKFIVLASDWWSKFHVTVTMTVLIPRIPKLSRTVIGSKNFVDSVP